MPTQPTAPVQPSPTAPHVRRATAADLPAITLADGRGFGVHYSEVDLQDQAKLLDPNRFLVATDPRDGVVGVAGSVAFDVTLPGGATLPAPGVTWVSVAVTQRRRGILRALIGEQHRAFVTDGAAISLLTASEGGIYGRFGYGVATTDRRVEIQRRRMAFRAGVVDPGGVTQADTAELRLVAPQIHREWAARTPGALSRDEALWDNVLADREHQRHGGTALFHLVHPDGYVSFRRMHDDRGLRIEEIVTATDEAHAALWRVLADTDLVETITAPSHPIDDPLADLLADSRQVRTMSIDDGMWARVLDVPAALSARRYGVEIDCVLDVHDPFLDSGGRYRLRGGPDGAMCERAPHGGGEAVGVDIAALGTLLLGGRRAGTLARAGLVRAPDAAVLGRLDRAFLADRVPQHGTDF